VFVRSFADRLSLVKSQQRISIITSISIIISSINHHSSRDTNDCYQYLFLSLTTSHVTKYTHHLISITIKTPTNQTRSIE